MVDLSDSKPIFKRKLQTPEVSYHMGLALKQKLDIFLSKKGQALESVVSANYSNNSSENYFIYHIDGVTAINHVRWETEQGYNTRAKIWLSLFSSSQESLSNLEKEILEVDGADILCSDAPKIKA